MLDLVKNHIVGFSTRWLSFYLWVSIALNTEALSVLKVCLNKLIVLSFKITNVLSGGIYRRCRGAKCLSFYVQLAF